MRSTSQLLRVTLFSLLLLSIQGNAEPTVQEIQQMAEQGQPTAQYHLGMMYLSGQGTPQNTSMAKKWLQQAAVQGDHEAKAALKNLK